MKRPRPTMHQDFSYFAETAEAIRNLTGGSAMNASLHVERLFPARDKVVNGGNSEEGKCEVVSSANGAIGVDGRSDSPGCSTGVCEKKIHKSKSNRIKNQKSKSKIENRTSKIEIEIEVEI